MKIAILHYSAPPVIGGVEQTIFYHARCLAHEGHAVRILAGAGESFDPQINLVLLAEAGSRHAEVALVQADLQRGQVSPAFFALRERLVKALGAALANVDVLIVHNVCTLHKNLALTAALHAYLAAPGACPVALAWHHDLAWTDGQYQPHLHAGYPWDLLRTPWPGVRHVTVSESRRHELADLYGLPPAGITVIPPGVDPALFWHWQDVTIELVKRYGLLCAAPLFLLPARLTRRKNIQLALEILAAFRLQTGQDARLIVTGPPGPHNPTNLAYLEDLLTLRRHLGLAGAAHFLYETGSPISDAVMADLYGLCDALLFPSMQEGFGIPILEAGLARLPIFCSAIPALRETAEGTAHFFEPNDDPAVVARAMAAILDADRAHLLRRRVLLSYTWQGIVQERLLPLLPLKETDP